MRKNDGFFSLNIFRVKVDFKVNEAALAPNLRPYIPYQPQNEE